MWKNCFSRLVHIFSCFVYIKPAAIYFSHSLDRFHFALYSFEKATYFHCCVLAMLSGRDTSSCV